MSDDDREKRREEALARLRAARERRAGEGEEPVEGEEPTDGEGDLEDIGYEEGDEGEFIDEELPPEGEELGPDELAPEGL